MRIAVDVMGGDHGCRVVVTGARRALRADPGITELHLVGDESQILPALGGAARDPRVIVHHASQVLGMEENPLSALRRKKDSSILRAVALVKEGRAEALISPGNTGGVVTATTIRLRPLPNVERPAIATIIPAPESEFLLIDAGANTECRPLHLLQFAVMGSLYAREMMGLRRPRVGLLSVGTEDVKGNDLTRETFKLCRQVDLHFIGNVEGHDLFLNRVDVVVCDGFTGNIVLKTCEGLAAGLFRWLRRELTKSPKRAMGAMLAKGAFQSIKRRIDPETRGGAPLLGLNGHVVIAHGSSGEHAIKNAIHQAVQAIQSGFNQTLARKITAATEQLHAARKTGAPVAP